MSGRPEQRTAAIAEAQSGQVARWQLLAAGLTPDMIHSRLRRGSLIVQARGVFAVGHVSSAPHVREVVALLGVPREALLSHLTAARLWGIHGARDEGADVHLLVHGSCGMRRAGVSFHRTNAKSAAARAYVAGLPTTTVGRTLRDIAPLVSARELEKALDETFARRLAARETLFRAASADMRHAGSGELRALLLARDARRGVTQSVAEDRFVELIRAAGLPEPRCNVRLHGFTVNFFWPDAGLIVEVDGYQWHSRKSAFERDRRKDAAMKSAGLDLMRVTWEGMHRRSLETVARLAERISSGRSRAAA